MAQTKLDIDNLSIEELQKIIDEKKKKVEEEKFKHFFEAKKIIEDNGSNFDQFLTWYKDNFSPVIFEIEYTDKNGKKQTFTRRKGQIGMIANDIKTALRSLGRDTLKNGIKSDYTEEGGKVLESIFKDRKP